MRSRWYVHVFAILLTVSTVDASEDKVLSDKLSEFQKFVSQNCNDCHSKDGPTANLDLESFDFSSEQFAKPDFKSGVWEKILRRIATRQMPPPTEIRPSEKQYQTIDAILSDVLEERSLQFPKPGKVGVLRRMTRLEYQNAIRDLLGINIDAASYLPKDESSHGFDNITVEQLSPVLLNRYVTAAQKISRAAIGGLGNGPVGVTIRLPADRSQEEHVAGLPFGTRGGAIVDQHFPQAGEYEIELKLTRDRDEKIEGLNHKHKIDVLLDRKRIHQFEVSPPSGKGDWRGKDYTHADSHLKARIKLPSGRHQIGITFPKTFSSLTEDKRQPFDANFNRHRHPRKTPAIYQISVVGPFAAEGPGKTQSRQLIFGTVNSSENRTDKDARLIITKLMKRAYRRPITEEDTNSIMPFYNKGVREQGYERGLEFALSAILINPNFLFRIEQSNSTSPTSKPYFEINSFELASRLSFFIWSSIPDDELLELASNGRLLNQSVLREQVQRMLKDKKSEALVKNFAAQWLYLRNLESITPDLRLFPDFDDNLRQSFRKETELFFNDVLENDLSVLNLIQSNHTFLNERLATHYGIPNVTGSVFRKVKLDPESHRGGILRHGSILMVTSYATRTSPTIRGNWVMENIFGTPAPPPPPNIPNLKENTTLDTASVRERLAAHRANPVCASCHDLIDPVGFSLENFDAVGRWRDFDGNIPVDSKGFLPDGTKITSVKDLEAGILSRPESFVNTLTEKLLTYSIGRAVEPFDGPAVRNIVHNSSEDGHKLSSIIQGIVLSEPFRMRSQ